MFLDVLPHWEDQNGNIDILFLLVEFRQTETLPPILQYVRGNHTSVIFLLMRSNTLPKSSITSLT